MESKISLTLGKGDSKDASGFDKDLIQGLTEKEVQVDHLESVIVALSTKIQTLNDMEKEQARNRQLIHEGDEGRTHLQVIIEESASQTAKRAEENKEYQEEITRENNELRDHMNDHANTIRVRDGTIHENEQAINSRNREIQELNMVLSNLKEMKAQNERLNKQINESQQDRNSLQRQFEKAIRDHEECMRKAREEWKRKEDDLVDTIRKRDAHLDKVTADFKKEMYDKEQAWDDERRNLHGKIDALTCEVQRLKEQLTVLEEIRSQRDKLQEALKQYQMSRDELHDEIER